MQTSLLLAVTLLLPLYYWPKITEDNTKYLFEVLSI